MSSGSKSRGLSIAGIALMIAGLLIVSLEVKTGIFFRQLGIVGYVLVVAVGTACSVWGLKELVAQTWPRLAGRGYYFRLPREGLVFLVLTFFFFGGSILGRSNLLMMVFAMMVGGFLVNGWLTFTMLRGSRMWRVLPERAMAGEPVAITLELENRNPWLSARLMTVHDTIIHSSVELEPEVLFVQVPPQSQGAGVYHFQPSVRGKYEFSRLDVTTRFPLGLVQRGVSRDLPQTLLVYPRMGHLRPDWRRLRASSAELSHQIRGAAGAFQDELHQLREYRVGDDRRMIHWRTSARMDELMVSEYQETRDRDLLLIVDAWLPKRPPAGLAEQFERGLRFATTIAMQTLHSTRQSALFVELLGKKTVSWRGDVERQPDALLDGFALLEPFRGESLDAVKQLLGNEWNRAKRIVVVSTRAPAIRELISQWQEGAPLEAEIFGTSADELNRIFVELPSTSLSPSPA
ncbi:DUF58 domain-containing protein [Planctomicrobium piriforme]|uniref:Uncharacterized conserved protein, DUF58 family, contains vWF domain n=1 Tax=Planctomicrobium piriforme TaxID=1576369 RepID=A0A1I3HGZ7_9PLAN|nr:DUF58 domain-containing protein [Planctomicrobium piriforme]SFI34889.1 Uncharacterized conserved protein, DUF58 family, contains vWF domain [Planctomicrobium piriforme]